MAINDIVQTIAEARVDARSLSEFVFKPANFTVTRRLAPSVRTLQYYIDIFDNLDVVLSSSVIAAQKSLNSSVAEAQGKVAYIETTVQDAINNTAVEGGVLADTFLTATAYHADTYARTQRSIRAESISLLDFIPIALHEGIKNYTYPVALGKYIKKAFDYCTLNNVALDVPAGGYLIDPAENDVVGVYMIDNWGADKNLIINGAGMGVTIFKESDGATTARGRYTKMFYVQCGVSTANVMSFGHIKWSNLTFDKNGRSNTNPLKEANDAAGLPQTGASRYIYESAMAVGLSGKGIVDIKSYTMENIELIDKIGTQVNFSAAPNIYIGKVSFTNVISRDNPKVEFWGDDTFGTKGCIEAATNIGTIDFISCDLEYIQIEPVIPSSPILQRRTNITGGRIDAVEFTDRGDYSFTNISNLSCSYKLLARGLQANITNSDFVARDMFAGGNIKISNSTIKLLYDADTNKITSLSHGQFSSYSDYSELHLTNVKIVIDNTDPTLRPTGYAISGNSAAKGAALKTLTNVSIDSRVDKGINAYGTGDWVISNSTLYGFTTQVDVGAVVGGGMELGGAVELHNNKYLGAGSVLAIASQSNNYTLKVSGTYPLDKFYANKGPTPIGAQILQKPMLTSSTKPTINAPKGQTVINLNPISGSYEKWIKLEEVNGAATWKGIGLIEGDAVVAAITSGTTAQRPAGVAVGFTYFDTTLGKPIYFKSTGVWVDSTGATV